MFDLEQSITDWRQQMLAAGIKTPVPLAELEIHLREEIERQMESGLDAQPAFELSVPRIGRAKLLQQEFDKTSGIWERKYMKPIVIVLAALFSTVLGGAMILPALDRWQHTGALSLMPLVVGVILIMAGASVAIYKIKTRREARGRKLISAGILAAGTFYWVPLIQAFFQQRVSGADWMICLFLAAASILFFGNCWRRNRFLPEDVHEYKSTRVI